MALGYWTTVVITGRVWGNEKALPETAGASLRVTETRGAIVESNSMMRRICDSITPPNLCGSVVCPELLQPFPSKEAAAQEKVYREYRARQYKSQPLGVNTGFGCKSKTRGPRAIQLRTDLPLMLPHKRLKLIFLDDQSCTSWFRAA
jgi:hypothetical protein